MSIFSGNKKEIPAGPVGIEEATNMVQKNIQEAALWGSETTERHQEILRQSMAGDAEAVKQAHEIIEKCLEKLGINEVEGWPSKKEVVHEIFKYAWGLDVIQHLYDDPEVNEIRVNSPDHVYVLRNIKNEKADVRFKDEQHVVKIIKRLIMHDRGIGLNKSSPTVESMRKDGTRITATGPPVSEYTTFVLRKHSARFFTPEELIEKETINQKVWDVLEVLVRGRANILLSGGVGSGKTTLLRTLFSLTPSLGRTLVLESDRELLLREYFPDRDIVEMEEHAETGRTLENLFSVILRYTPDIIIMGEFRGGGEARSAIEACTRGHEGSMATAHFSTPQEAVEGTARLLLREGYNVPPEIASAMVASAYNVVVQMFGDFTRGIIKLEKITEVYARGTQIVYNDLVCWVPDGDDYAVGHWEIVGRPHSPLKNRLKRFGIGETHIQKVFYMLEKPLVKGVM